ncbi:MAG TPA: CocE/NonD family hydrolase [Rhodothermales bacterium]|nr:CocE/NonD family hydrolase [Rhodothermales bacterium]
MTYLFRTIGSLLLLGLCSLSQHATAQDQVVEESRVVVESGRWHLVGDLLLPASEHALPAVLMLNQAAGDRTVYRDLAHQLAARGMASLRLDLRGHGESTNLGRFVPGERPRSPLIWDAEVDVIAAHDYLKAHPRIDGERIGIVGGSYSGEEMAEAGRANGYAQTYVALSPGSFSEESIRGIDDSGVGWLFIASKNDRYLQEITAAVQAQSKTVELVVVPGTEHATDILETHPEMAERIAVWLAQQFRE